MDSSGHLSIGNSTAGPATQAKRRGRPRKHPVDAPESPATERTYAAVGTLTRTKSLIAAALKVWELKQRGLGR
jgi:hypothetical protein